MSATAQSALRVTVTKDKLRAEMAVAGIHPEDITPELTITRLQELAIPLTEETTARILALVQSVREGKLKDKTVVLLEGRPAVPAKPASFKPAGDEAEQEPQENEDVVYDGRQCRIQTVQADDVIGEYLPEVPSTSGVDVYGHPVNASEYICNLQLAANVRLGDDGKTVFATCNGKVQVTRQSVSVVEVVEVKGDVDLTSGNVDVPTDVLVTGTVRDTFVVKSAKSVTIKGTVEAATVEAGTNITIAGGVTARKSGKVRAGGEIQAKFFDEADVEAAGDVVVTKQVLNSRVNTRGRLLVPRGPLIGGMIYAREGVEAQFVGNEANLRTEIAVGIWPEALSQVADIDHVIKKRKEAAAKIRQIVQPLLVNLKRLNPQQREKATELMFEADQFDAEVAELLKKRQETLAPYSPPAGQEVSIMIKSMLYRGSILIFGDKMTTVSKDRHGPVRIMREQVDRIEEVVVHDLLSGSTQIMRSMAYPPPDAAPA